MIKALKKKIKIHSAGDAISVALYALLWIALILSAASMRVLPLYMLNTSLKADNLECIYSPFGLPERANWGNFKEIFVIFDEKMEVSVAGMFSVSILTSVLKPFLAIFFTTLFAYVEAKYDFFGRKFLFNLGIVLMILPIVGSLPSAMQVSKALGVYDNLFMNIITSPSGCFYGTNFLLMYGAFKVIPWDYAEAAYIDGANDYTVLFSIYIRMVLPQAVVLFVLSFMGAWNDYNTYLIWLPSTPNISYGMYLFYQRANAYRVSLPELMAGFTVVMLPTVILYCGTQKIITGKFVVGGLKG